LLFFCFFFPRVTHLFFLHGRGALPRSPGLVYRWHGTTGSPSSRLRLLIVAVARSLHSEWTGCNGGHSAPQLVFGILLSKSLSRPLELDAQRKKNSEDAALSLVRLRLRRCC
jgi:hypothetical protein